MTVSKRLYRSKKNKVFAGICGGVGEYFNIDPALIRLIWVFDGYLYRIFSGSFSLHLCHFYSPREKKLVYHLFFNK